MFPASFRGDRSMIIATLTKLAQRHAMGTLILRGGIVGINFAVMIGLAAWLGLGAFGALAVVWGLALVASTALSLGGPLMLLRHLTDGGGVSSQTIVWQVMVLPVVLAVVAYPVLVSAFPDLPWLPILAMGLGINLMTCLASIMRALGSLQMSMALRDAGPQVALGLGVVAGPYTGEGLILMQSLIWLGLLAAVAGFWCARHVNFEALICNGGKRAGLAWSLWGTAVLGMALAQVDIIAAGSLLTPEQVGIYALLRRIANLVALPVSVATWVSAAPVSAAFGAGNPARLQQASASGSQIAFVPAMLLFCVGCAALPLLPLITDGTEARWLCVVLLTGALVQAVFASGYTVATLCAQGPLAALTRLFSLGIYVTGVWILGAAMVGPVENALLYVGATSIGSLGLWCALRQRMGIDTSAMVLLRKQEPAWKPS